MVNKDYYYLIYCVYKVSDCFAKYQIVSAKAVVQVDFTAKHKANPS